MISINNILRENIEFDANGNTIIKDQSVNEALKKIVGPDSRGWSLIKNLNINVIGGQANNNQ